MTGQPIRFFLPVMLLTVVRRLFHFDGLIAYVSLSSVVEDRKYSALLADCAAAAPSRNCMHIFRDQRGEADLKLVFKQFLFTYS